MTLKELLEDEQTDERALIQNGNEESFSNDQSRGYRGGPDEHDDIETDTIDRDDDDHRNIPSERYINRLIRVNVPKIPVGEKANRLWLFNPGFLEQLVLNNFDEKSQRRLWRRWQDIEHQNQGDGNDELVQSRQRSLAVRIISQRGRSDLAEAGTRERMALVTSENRQRVHQTVTTDRGSGVKAVSFLSRLFGK